MELHEFISGAFKLIGFVLQVFWDTLVALFWRGELLEAITPPQGRIPRGARRLCRSGRTDVVAREPHFKPLKGPLMSSDFEDLARQGAEQALVAAIKLRLLKSAAGMEAEAERLARNFEHDGHPEVSEKIRETLGNGGSLLSLPAPGKKRGRPRKDQNGGE